jgi:hypothetical protein
MDISETLPYVGPFLGIIGFISGVWYRLEGKITAAVADAKSAGTAAAKKAEDAEKSLNEFKLKVVEEYASWDTVRAIETRLTARMDNLSEQVMKMPDAISDRLLKMLNLNNIGK